jgi:hypothetical protein
MAMLTEFVWVTGLVKLLTDASVALYFILPGLALVIIVWNVVKRLQADDHGMTINGFITMLLSYFPSS